MTDLSPRPNRTPRRSREDRAYKLVIAGGAAAVIAVVTFVLAIVGIMGFGVPVLAAIVAVLCGWLFRRTVT
jgi:putative flippase GtrA